MTTTTETRVPSPETEVAKEAPAANLPQQATGLKIPEPARDSQGNPIRVFGHTATKDFGEVVGAIAAVMMDLHPVEKGGKNTFHGYKYARMQDILQMLTPLMGKHGLVVFQYESDRNMFDDGKVIAITYRFIVAHKSGQTWIDQVPQTGMSPCRTTKGTFDDKAFAKCHTAARKYFLLSLFQVPTEDEADTDNEQAPAAAAAAAPVPGPDGHIPPHRIMPVKGETPKTWSTKYRNAIQTSRTDADLVEWDNLNDDLLNRLAEQAEDIYADVMKKFEGLRKDRQRADGLADALAQQTVSSAQGKPVTTQGQASTVQQTATVPPATTAFVRPEGCPDANKDPDGFMKWASDFMARITSAQELDIVWEGTITPASDGLFKPDCDALDELYQGHQKRLGG